MWWQIRPRTLRRKRGRTGPAARSLLRHLHGFPWAAGRFTLIRFFSSWSGSGWRVIAARCVLDVRVAPPRDAVNGCPLAERPRSLALPSPVRLGWLRIPIVGAILGVALTCRRVRGAVAEPPVVQFDLWLRPINQARLRTRVASMARDMLVPGAVALVRSPGGELSTTYGTTTLGGTAPVSLADHVRWIDHQDVDRHRDHAAGPGGQAQPR